MKRTISILSLLVLSVGCGSSNNTVRGAAWCTSEYSVSKNAIPGESTIPGAKAKTKLEDDTNLQLTQGDYALRELDVYFNDTNRDIRAHVQFKIDEEGEYTAARKCIGTNSGQINADMEDYVFELDVFSLMKVDPSGKSLLADATVKVEFSYTSDDEPLFKTPTYVEQEGEPAEKNLKDTFKTGFSERDQYLFTLENAYEMQNKLKAPTLIIETRQRWIKK